MRVHGRVTPNDVSVAAIHEEVDTKKSWDGLGHDGFHMASAKGPDEGFHVGVHEGLDGQRQVVPERVGFEHSFPGTGGEAELRTFPAQPFLVLPQGFSEEDATLPRIYARLKSTDGASRLLDRQGKDRGSVLPDRRSVRSGAARLRSTSDWSVLPDRRSVRSGAARLRSTSDSRFRPILVPELVAVVIEEVLERVRAAIARNAALLCAHNGGTATGPGRGRALRLSTSSTSSIRIKRTYNDKDCVTDDIRSKRQNHIRVKRHYMTASTIHLHERGTSQTKSKQQQQQL